MKIHRKLITGLTALALTGAIPQVASAADLSSSDKKFVMKAANGNMVEVKLGELAESKAERENVKEFGEMMVKNHGDANDKLKEAVEGKGVEFPMALDEKHQKTVDELSKLSGAEFDKKYVEEMVDDHKKDLKLYEKALEDVEDEDLKKYIEETLPTLKKHLAEIQEIEKAE